MKIEIKTGTSHSAERLQATWGPFSAKYKAFANELHQEITQLRCYEDNYSLVTAIRSVKINS